MTIESNWKEEEYRAAMQEAFNLIHYASASQLETAAMQVATLLRDSMSRVDEGKRFVTANTKTVMVSGLEIEYIDDDKPTR